jgi:hypothetical protein
VSQGFLLPLLHMRLFVCPALQLRLKCLETLLQLLQLIQADPAAAAAFRSATAAAAPQQHADANGSGAAGSSLPGVVSACLSGVSANDPSVAHKALAAQAAAVLGQMGARPA